MQLRLSPSNVWVPKAACQQRTRSLYSWQRISILNRPLKAPLARSAFAGPKSLWKVYSIQAIHSHATNTSALYITKGVNEWGCNASFIGIQKEFTMQRHGILNSHIAKVLADLGHTDTICISDCGLPVPEGVQKIDLALDFGVPSFEQSGIHHR